MEEESKYKNYAVEDFVDDKAFRNWVNLPDKISNTFWDEFLIKYPEKSESVSLARQIVDSLFIEEVVVPYTEYASSIDELKDMMDKKSTDIDNTRKLFVWIRNIAAILLLPTVIFSIYQYQNKPLFHSSEYTEYIVPIGQKSNLILADGTRVWLNSGSTLAVSTDNTKERKVKLSGEAYFDVVKNKYIPFIVETKKYSIKVFGTQFDVRDYSYQTESETILKEGAICIQTNHSNEKIMMTPGQSFSIDQKNKHTLTQVNPDIYISWKDNILKINNEKLEDLLVKMEHWYGVTIHVDNYELVKNLKYTFTIKTESLKEMLDYMNYITPFSYKIEGEQVNLNYKLK